MRLSAHYGLELCEQTVKLHFGGVCIAQGQLELGIETIDESLAAAALGGARLGTSAWFWMLAEAHAACGRVDEALLQLEHGFARVQAVDERFWEPELFRTLGAILLAAPDAALPVACQAALEGGPASSERCFSRALELASSMQARPLEQRARQALTLLGQARCGLSVRAERAC
jgi:hypothetical protein